MVLYLKIQKRKTKKKKNLVLTLIFFYKKKNQCLKSKLKIRHVQIYLCLNMNYRLDKVQNRQKKKKY